MKTNLNEKLKNLRSRAKAKAKLKGSQLTRYNTLVTVIVLLIAVMVNVLASFVPGNLTQLDMSSAKLYSVTSNTKMVANALTKDVTIYWICQSGEEDTVIERLLDKYDALSSHITVERKNPDIYPTFAENYTDGDVYNNDLVVECGDKYRYLSMYEDLYEYDTTYYYYTGSYDVYFDGEGQITSAIDYVTSDDLPKMYLLTGHGESSLSDSMLSSIEKENIETEEFSLLTVDEVPEDADLIMINAPSSDISEEEKNMLESYVDGGGKLLVIAGPVSGTTLDNLNALAAYYGITVSDGVIIEGNRNYYAYGASYRLIPEIESTDITDPLLEDTNYVIMAISSGLTIENTPSGVTAEELLTTSVESYIKVAGYDLTTYDFEDGDSYGPYALGVAVTKTNSEGEDGKMVWFSSSYLLDDTYNSYSSGANLDIAVNSLYWLIGERDAISIRSKSLNLEYLTISESAAAYLKIVMLVIVPLFFLAMGISTLLQRRKM